jgi:hypothetical protein
VLDKNETNSKEFHILWDSYKCGLFPRWMHQFIRIPVDRTLMANESSAHKEGTVSKSSAKQTENTPPSMFGMIAFFFFLLTFVLWLISFLYYAIKAKDDLGGSQKTKVDEECGDGLFWIVYVHFIVHVISFIFFSCMMCYVWFAIQEQSALKDGGGVSPLCVCLLLVVFCIGCIVAFSCMAAQMEERFQDALEKPMCVDALSSYGLSPYYTVRPDPYPLKALRYMYLTMDILYCVFFFVFMCAACFMVIYPEQGGAAEMHGSP